MGPKLGTPMDIGYRLAQYPPSDFSVFLCLGGNGALVYFVNSSLSDCWKHWFGRWEVAAAHRCYMTGGVPCKSGLA